MNYDVPINYLTLALNDAKRELQATLDANEDHRKANARLSVENDLLLDSNSRLAEKLNEANRRLDALDYAVNGR